MNEISLNAVLNLFAIRTTRFAPDERAAAAAVVGRYLRSHLRIAQPQAYVELFEAAVDLHRGGDPGADLAVARTIAANLKSRLPRLEQLVLVMYDLELAKAGRIEQAALDEVVASELGIPRDVLNDLALLTFLTFLARGDLDPSRLTHRFLLVNGPGGGEPGPCRRLGRPEFRASLLVYHATDADAWLVVPRGDEPVSADSVELSPQRPHLLAPGFILRDGHGTRLYHAELAAAFHAGSPSALVFRAEDLELRYPGSDSGLHRFSCCETGGRLVGIMGGSGAGKSTLLGILTGQTAPDRGRVTINGIDVHREARRLEGVIGYVPQDDLLFEDLSVFDNLLFSASLSLANLPAPARAARVDALLEELHQAPIRDLKVGSPLEKTISGGERKRLNIALELIREPSVLFVDEPTSGLSSADSENVMALLKAQAARDKLVIVVIHQPSSRIFKMLDSLWILDQGGRPIYAGNPLDAIVYFRTQTHQAGMEEYACPACGNVNPEQIFEIIEARAVDGRGGFGRQRRVSPEEWHRRHLAEGSQEEPPGLAGVEEARAVDRRLWRPGLLGQLGVFFHRTLKSRVANSQYLLVNLLVPPLLALVAALVCRGARGSEYVFMENGNLSNYFFISVIVALFLGMIVSAEEINRDRRILSRERFLHLSWLSYVSAKALYLSLVVAMQMAVFTLIGNSILRVPDMNAATWFTLFSCALVSSLLGLNVSATFRSAVSIYIVIPLLLVPQIILGGASVPFDELMHRHAGSRNVPWVAELMPSRWGYEALLVRQYVFNRYTRRFFADECDITRSDYAIHLYVPEMRALADYPLLETGGAEHAAEAALRLRALARELGLLEERTGIPSGLEGPLLEPGSYTPDTCNRVKAYLERVVDHYRGIRQEAIARKRAVEKELHESVGIEGAEALRRTHSNKDVAAIAMNTRALEAVRLSGDRLVQVAAPVCQVPESRLGSAHFMAAVKRVGSWTVSTVPFDLAVLWAMSAVLFLALWGSLLPRAVGAAGRIPGALRSIRFFPAPGERSPGTASKGETS